MPVRDDILDPIPGSCPSGVDLIESSGIRLNEIRQARREDPPGITRREHDPPPRVADWARVLKLCNDTLAETSKDLEIAGYLCEALLKREGLEGFSAGLDVVRALLERFWDTVYPSLEEAPGEPPYAARAAKLEWLGSRYKELGFRSLRDRRPAGYLHPHFLLLPLCKQGYGLGKYNEARDVGSERECADNATLVGQRQQKIDQGKMPLEEFERAVLDTDKAFFKKLASDTSACQRSLEALRQVAKDRFAGASSDVWGFDAIGDDLSELAEVVGSFLAQALLKDPDPIASIPIAADDADGSVEAEASDAPLAVEVSSVEDATRRLAKVAEYLRANAPTSPGSYLMLRGFRWGELRAHAPHIDPKLLVAPPTSVRSLLKTLSLDGRWKELLEQGERVMARPDGRGWLDLQRHAVTACENLGDEYERVAAALRSELTLLLRDLPSLLDATLMDDTPTASAETRQWLLDQGIVQTSAASGESAGAAEAPAPPTVRVVRTLRAAIDQVYEEALDALRAGQAKRAVELLMTEAARERSPRGQFLRKTQVAEVMVNAEMRQMAFPILDELEEIINNRGLQQWEAGDIVARPLALLFRCLPEESERREDLYRLICKLDPVCAMGLR